MGLLQFRAVPGADETGLRGGLRYGTDLFLLPSDRRRVRSGVLRARLFNSNLTQAIVDVFRVKADFQSTFLLFFG